MRKYTAKDGRAERSVVIFDSFTDMLDTNLKRDYRSAFMDDPKWYGNVNNMAEAHDLANRGLPREGVTAIKLAKDSVDQMKGEILRPTIYDEFDVSGAVVDMDRFITGVPECMVEYYPIEQSSEDRIVTLIMNISYHSGISAKAILKQGQAMMGLVEAIELTGRQAEIWTDMNVSGYDYGTNESVYARTAVRLKQAGGAFDVGMFMYALTHPSYLRCHMLNAMHNHPDKFRDACGISAFGHYGSPVTTAQDMDDFPAFSIYVPTIRRNEDAGEFVTATLKRLGLVAA